MKKRTKIIIGSIISGVFLLVILLVNNRPASSLSNDLERKSMLPLPLSMPLDGWKRIYIDGIGTIDIPPTLEIQSGLYSELIKALGMESEQGYDIIIQPRGLNEFRPEAFQRYARIMIRTVIGDNNEFETLYFNIDDLRNSDVIEMDRISYSSIQSGLLETGSRIVSWFPLEFKIINGMSCMRISYIRQLDDNPPVVVNIIAFQNVDRIHNLTLSYRQNEEDYWLNDFEIALNSFRIVDIK